MTGSLNQVRAQHLRAHSLLQPLERAGILVHPPVALASNKERRLIDGAAGKQLQLRGEAGDRADAITLEPALKSGAAVLAAVDAQLLVGQPLAPRDLGGRRHL